MGVILNNIARAKLSASLTTTATTVLLTTGDGARFPAPTGEDWFPLALEDASGNIELCKATARNGDSITVQRAQEGTMARAFPAGAAAELRMTVSSLLAFILQNLPTNTGGGGETVDISQLLKRISNLSDVPDKAAARDNLGVYSKTQVDSAIETAKTGGQADLGAYMKKADNLADLGDVGAARSNISVYSKAEVDNLLNSGGGSSAEPSPFVPGNINSIGAYRSFNQETRLDSGAQLPMVGTTMQGTSLGTTGTWRIHGVIDIGNAVYGEENGIWYRRYALICLRVS